MSRKRMSSVARPLHARREALLRRSDKLRERMVLRGQQLEPSFSTIDRVVNGMRTLRRSRILWLALGGGAAALTALRPNAASRVGLLAWSAWQATHRGHATLSKLLQARR